MTSWPGHRWQGPPSHHPQFPHGVDPRHVYVPPQAYPHSPPGWWNTDTYNLRSPPASQYRSPKHPNLNPTLAEDTTHLRFDIRQKPSNTILTSTYYSNRHAVALAKPTTHMRLVSKAFPWQIDIKSPANITCEDVWESLYMALQEPIADSEWGFIIKDKKHKETVENAAKKRVESDPNADKRPKRIDYLGDNTLFRGLDKDDDFVKLRLLPHSPGCAETWMIKLMS
ncbi:hypothetical protein B0H34DRAFT_733772 [Crassisporium funariophilum]|nr:hypothetical protein B0H34DRAFT_733772 [Crassisporium funariophilum]